MGLNTIFDLGINSKLKKLANQLGADCPFFIDNTPSYAIGTGEILKPVKINFSNHYLLVVKPNIFISTEKAFDYIIPKPKFSLLNEINKPMKSGR